jgi:MinD superfamily P-loop ATPase
MPAHPSPTKIPSIDEGKCQACRECAARDVCKVKAIIALDPGEAPFVNAALCYGCMICIPACPFEAIAA